MSGDPFALAESTRRSNQEDAQRRIAIGNRKIVSLYSVIEAHSDQFQKRRIEFDRGINRDNVMECIFVGQYVVQYIFFVGRDDGFYSIELWDWSIRQNLLRLAPAPEREDFVYSNSYDPLRDPYASPARLARPEDTLNKIRRLGAYGYPLGFSEEETLQNLGTFFIERYADVGAALPKIESRHRDQAGWFPQSIIQKPNLPTSGPTRKVWLSVSFAILALITLIFLTRKF